MPNLNSCLLTSFLEISMTPEEEDEYSLEDKFHAAVKVIRTLPEDGPFQPSDDMMLMFYSYYKQATSGPCNILRPTGFWDTRGKAKWDAWSALGNMTSEEAMKNYVEDIQLILEAIPISSEVTDLVQKLGNFYTEVESNDGDAEENKPDSRPFTRPFANHKDEPVMKPTIQGFGDLWDDIQNIAETENEDIFPGVSVEYAESKGRKHRGENTDSEGDSSNDGNQDEEETVDQVMWACNPDPMRLMAENRRWSSDKPCSNRSSLEPSVSSLTNGTHSSLNTEVEEEELACSLETVIHKNPYMHFIGHPSGCSVATLKNAKSPDSDNEEFCDSMEHLAMDEVFPTSHGSRTTSLRHSDPWFDSCSAVNSTNNFHVVDGMETTEYKSALSGRGTGTGSTGGSPFALNIISDCCCGSKRPQSLYSSRNKLNEDICSALLRLQQDMDSVLYKLQTLEVLAASRAPSPAPNHYLLATVFQFCRPSWWPLQTSPIAVFFTVVWPVFAHWLVKLYFRRKRRTIT